MLRLFTNAIAVMNFEFLSILSALPARGQFQTISRRPPWPIDLLALGLCGGALLSAQAQSDRVVITNAPGYAITWDGNNGGFSSGEPGAVAPDNLALASQGAIAFGSTAFLPGGIHDFPNVIDGFYGNSSSWISDFGLPDTNPFVGIAFGHPVTLTNLAWSRDNGDDAERTPAGPYADRATGTYILQITSASNPDSSTPETENAATGWATIGSVTYKAGTDNLAFSAYLRHRFDLSADDQPLSATGLRIKVSDGGTAIDELEVNGPPEPTPPLSSFVSITSAAGYSVSWDGNDGSFSDTNTLAHAAINRALTGAGVTAFGSSEFGRGVHYIANIIDGLYGNKHSWISDFTRPDTNAFVGVAFTSPIPLNSVAWGRDNGDQTEGPSNPNTDRALGLYTIQVTSLASPGVATPESANPEMGWATVGTVDYRNDSATFHAYARHRFDLRQNGTPINATGIRIKVSNNGTAIDELEVNPQENVSIKTAPGFAITWNGNDGNYFSPAEGAGAPENVALAGGGATAFGSSELDFGGLHLISHLNDGLYGNSHSWISDQGIGAGTDTSLFVGISFGRIIGLRDLAWSRDNGDTNEAGCGGTCMDRSLGTYTLQVTRVANPGVDTPETGDATSGWISIGTVAYLGQDDSFHPWLRHRFELATANGEAIQVTGLRFLVPDGNTAIDEIEVNTAAPAPALTLAVSRQATSLTISWTGMGTLQVSDKVPGEWVDMPGATAPHTVSANAKEKYFRVRQ